MTQKKTYADKSFAAIAKRRNAILKIKYAYMDRKEKLTSATLRSELEKLGFAISRKTLYSDLIEISKGNNYVRNIAEYTYSEEIEKMATSLDIIEGEYWKWLRDPPSIKRQKVVADGKNADGSTKYKVVENVIETISPIVIADKIREIVMAKKDLLSGDVMNLSIVMLAEKYRIMEQKVREAEQMNILPPKGDRYD